MSEPIRLFPDDVMPDVEPDNTTEILPPPSAPMDVVMALVPELERDDVLAIRYWRGDWWQYLGPHWVDMEPMALRKWLYFRLMDTKYETRGAEGEVERKAWSPDKSKVDKLIDALIAPTLLERGADAPFWLSTGESAAGLVPCENGLVDVVTREVRPLTPDYFGVVGVPFSYDANAPEPVEWLRFLRTLWPRVVDDGGVMVDAPEIQALQEWFGYVLSGRMDLQKMLLLVGPPRSGKGTIARVLTDLIGKANVAAPTLAGMATNFGLQPLLGKPLGIIGDARLQSNGQEAVVERLLSITGQDSITVDRKNRAAWTGTIPARLMIMSNELPKFGDASGAIASRFVILTFQQSFLGQEDVELGNRLAAELPSILRWALDGLSRLGHDGRLTEPAASAEAVQELADLVSPISAFLREVCEIDPDAAVPFADLYKEYGVWCRENTRGQTNTARFSSDIRTRVPQLKTDFRPRNAAGLKMPRHVKGMRISDDWRTRIKDVPMWRSTFGAPV